MYQTVLDDEASDTVVLYSSLLASSEYVLILAALCLAPNQLRSGICYMYDVVLNSYGSGTCSAETSV